MVASVREEAAAVAPMKHFPYDVFLSHRRVGDNAPLFRDQLVACGCTVWFDEDKPLRDRKLFPLIRKAHADSRVTISYLSCGHAPSPWTVLEMLTALRRERLFGIQCLFFYGSTEAFALARTWSMPEELRLALADPERRLDAETSVFANHIRELNKNASSVKPVGELRLRKLAKHVIQGELSDSEGACCRRPKTEPLIEVVPIQN